MPSPSLERSEQFVELFTRFQRNIFGYLYTLVLNYSDAEDLLQQTSLILWRKFDTFEPGTDFVAWACRIAHLEALNFLKSRDRRRVHLSFDALALVAETRLDRAEVHERQRQALDVCIRQLSDLDQQMVQVCYGGQHTIKEAAQTLGRPLSSVYSRLCRIRRTLLDCVNRALAQEEHPE